VPVYSQVRQRIARTHLRTHTGTHHDNVGDRDAPVTGAKVQAARTVVEKKRSVTSGSVVCSHLWKFTNPDSVWDSERREREKLHFLAVTVVAEAAATAVTYRWSS
jgi:hypothetical protein